MAEASDRFIIDYLLSCNSGEMMKKNDHETSFTKIGERNNTDMIQPNLFPTDLNLNSIKLNRPLITNGIN